VGRVLAIGLAFTVIAIGVVLSGSPAAVIGANSVKDGEPLATTNSDAGACQAGESVPAGTAAIRLALESVTGPQVSVEALAGPRVLTRGSVDSGWTGGTVTVPVRRVVRASRRVRICFRLGPTVEGISILGKRTRNATALGGEGVRLPGRIGIEYMRSAHGSWWSLADDVARRMGLGRAPAGTWIVLPLAALVIMVAVGASWLALRELK
jgi:hypothetical protein